MLPRRVYELLPYIYILTGIVSTLLIDSTIMLMSSMLLILTGVLVLLLRRNFRKSLNNKLRANLNYTGPAMLDNYVQRSGVDRRYRRTTVSPILDDAGNRIHADRRMGERRISAV